jgi:hypothetical protein
MCVILSEASNPPAFVFAFRFGIALHLAFVFAFVLSPSPKAEDPLLHFAVARCPKPLFQPCPSPNKQNRHLDRSEAKWRNSLLHSRRHAILVEEQKVSSLPSSSSPL